MVEYKVTVSTTNIATATTFSNVFIKLVGTDGESDRTWLLSLKGVASFFRGAVSSFTVSCPASLGKLVLIELDKQRLPFIPEDSWFPAKVEVKSPEGETYHFPIYRWITDNEVHRFREGTGYWDVYAEGIPHIIKAESPSSLPSEVRFSFTKSTEFDIQSHSSKIFKCSNVRLLDLSRFLRIVGSQKKSQCNSYINKVQTHEVHLFSVLFPEYVQQHWKEDALFAYQFLNGVNPMLIRRCTVLPRNFPVTDDMVCLHGQGSLGDEMKKGNIFLCDYKNFDGLKANTINGKKQYLMAPLILLHKTPEHKLMPIAIQLKQTPADDNPIFLPTDSEYDWLIAKIFVRSTDFNEHQLNVHLLRTHLLAEVFAVSLLRNLPMVHPLYKLLVPHTRYTLQINLLARIRLISESGVFTQFTSSGGEAMATILKRSLASVTYSSLCIPDDITERGLQNVPNFYYRDDGLQLWDIINSYYYKTDAEVQKDSELQKWILDIFEHGFLSQPDKGEIKIYLGLILFKSTTNHHRITQSQFDFRDISLSIQEYDYGGWMPNTPTSLQLPPPTTKGTTDETRMLQTLPDVNATVQGMASLWLLSKPSSDFVALGQYPEEHFSEEVPRKLIKDFQGELGVLSAAIKIRNQSLEIPYTCMDPAEFENSVAI
uniref:Uncharacterized protein n=1 Tax=Echeneis naucrates TaxID=173247 RepID=A0A665XD62_ECHNA